MIMKFINSPRKAPQLITIGPIPNVAVRQAPPGIKGVIIGMTILSTKDFMKAVDAIPMIKAIASGITLYSKRNSLNPLINPMLSFSKIKVFHLYTLLFLCDILAIDYKCNLYRQYFKLIMRKIVSGKKLLQHEIF